MFHWNYSSSPSRASGFRHLNTSTGGDKNILQSEYTDENIMRKYCLHESGQGFAWNCVLIEIWLPSILVPNAPRRRTSPRNNRAVCVNASDLKKWHCAHLSVLSAVRTLVLSSFSLFQAGPSLKPRAPWSPGPRAWPCRTWRTCAWPAYPATLGLATEASTAAATTCSSRDGARWTPRWSDCYRPLTKTVSKHIYYT